MQSPPSTCSRRRITSKPSRTLVVRKESLMSVVRRLRFDELQPVRFELRFHLVEEARFGLRIGVKSLPREIRAARELCELVCQIRPSLKVILRDRSINNAFVLTKDDADACAQLSLQVFHLLPALLGHATLVQPVQLLFVGQPSRARAERAHARRLNLCLRH